MINFVANFEVPGIEDRRLEDEGRHTDAERHGSDIAEQHFDYI